MDTDDKDTEGITPEQLVAKYQTVQVQPAGLVLEGLDLVNWSDLHHAHGEASDVPALLRATLSEDERDRQFAFMLLHETIWHQGTVYEASAHVVPFLLRMLESPETPDKASVALLLASLADGHSYLEAHAFHDEKSEVTWRRILAKDGRELETELAHEVGWVNATKEAIEKGLSALYPYLDHEDSTVRGSIATALSFYPEYSRETLPRLQKSLSVESNKYTSEEMRVAIEKLGGESAS